MRGIRGIGSLWVAVSIALASGCAVFRPAVEKEPDKMKLEYDSFVAVTPQCLDSLKARVAKDFKGEYVYKNTIGSREPHYREAVFTEISGAAGDSAVIVKFDSACVVKRAYRTKMVMSEESKYE